MCSRIAAAAIDGLIIVAVGEEITVGDYLEQLAKTTKLGIFVSCTESGACLRVCLRVWLPACIQVCLPNTDRVLVLRAGRDAIDRAFAEVAKRMVSLFSACR